MADAGYTSLYERTWNVPQGADTINAFRYGYVDDTDTIVYPDLTTGWSARSQMRPSVGATPWVQFLSSSVTGPRIELDDIGTIYVILPHETTEDPAWNTRVVGFYDVELINPDGYVTRVMAGQVIVSHDVTRS